MSLSLFGSDQLLPACTPVPGAQQVVLDKDENGIIGGYVDGAGIDEFCIAASGASEGVCEVSGICGSAGLFVTAAKDEHCRT